MENYSNCEEKIAKYCYEIYKKDQKKGKDGRVDWTRKEIDAIFPECKNVSLIEGGGLFKPSAIEGKPDQIRLKTIEASRYFDPKEREVQDKPMNKFTNNGVMLNSKMTGRDNIEKPKKSFWNAFFAFVKKKLLGSES